MVFGVRILAVGEFAALVRRPPREHVMGWVLMMFVLIGPLISLTSAIVPRGTDRYYNNAIWFLVQSKYVAWIPATSILLLLWTRWRTVLPRLVLISLVAAGSLPSTIQFLVWVHENAPRIKLDSASVRALECLRHEAKEGDVVFSQLDGPLLCTTSLRVPYHPIFPSSFVTQAEKLKRRDAEAAFWNAWQHDELRVDLLARYNAKWILATRWTKMTGAPGCRIIRVFKDTQVRVFRVERAEEGLALPGEPSSQPGALLVQRGPAPVTPEKSGGTHD
jgi:hypothetical protein